MPPALSIWGTAGRAKPGPPDAPDLSVRSLAMAAPQRPSPSRPTGRSRSDRPRKQADPVEEAPREVVLADNRKARFNYAIDRKLEAGLALTGTEIKSVRAGRTNLSDGYAKIDRGEAWLRNVHIAPWQNAIGFEVHAPIRPRKLLLHREDIAWLSGEVGQQGYTIVPLPPSVKNG